MAKTKEETQEILMGFVAENYMARLQKASIKEVTLQERRNFDENLITYTGMMVIGMELALANPAVARALISSTKVDDDSETLAYSYMDSVAAIMADTLELEKTPIPF